MQRGPIVRRRLGGKRVVERIVVLTYVVVVHCAGSLWGEVDLPAFSVWQTAGVAHHHVEAAFLQRLRADGVEVVDAGHHGVHCVALLVFRDNNDFANTMTNKAKQDNHNLQVYLANTYKQDMINNEKRKKAEREQEKQFALRMQELEMQKAQDNTAADRAKMDNYRKDLKDAMDYATFMK